MLQISNISNIDHISYNVRSYFILQFHNVIGYFNIGIWVTHLDKCFKVVKTAVQAQTMWSMLIYKILQDTSFLIGLMVNSERELFTLINSGIYKKSWQLSTYYCRFNVKSTCTQYAVVNCAEYSMPPLCLPFLVTMEIPITYTSAMYTMGTLTLSLIRLLTLNSRELNQGPQLVLLQSHGINSIPTLAK